MPEVLVTGGAGYIGSVVTELLVERGFRTVVLDNFSGGYRQAIVPGAEIIEADVLDRAALGRAFAAHRFDAVLHFAALISVGESVQQPVRYYRLNVGGLMNVLDAMQSAGVHRIVFSSTAAVYGVPAETPISEQCAVQPINPYGWSKNICEKILMDATGGESRPALDYIALRYFNVAGASARCGEAHVPETHLIPRILEVAEGRRAHVELYGTDYPTPDGTCIRDYIHVQDLAEAHLLALDALLGPRPPAQRFFNLGNNRGYSVREVITTVERVTGKSLAVRAHPRREGDSPALVARYDLAAQVLGWKPHRSLDEIIESAWAWRRRHPNGYSS